MKIAFRADASQATGSGHVMRCLTLAKALRERGAASVFVCREHPGHLCDLISSQGFSVFRLKEGQDPADDAGATLEALMPIKPLDFLVVDHYGLDAVFESAMRKIARSVMVIDDLADRRHDCDLLLDQNLSAGMPERYEHLTGPDTVRFFGPRYALLGKAFSELRPVLVRDMPEKKRMVVSFGGADLADATGRVLSCMRDEAFSSWTIEAVAGPANPNIRDLEKICKGAGNIRIFRQTENMAEFLSGAAVAIGGGGVSALERCALGIPSLIFSIAKNQVAPSMGLSALGAAIYMGEAKDIQTHNLVETLQRLMTRGHAWRTMSRIAMDTVDARGASRIADYMTGKKEAAK